MPRKVRLKWPIEGYQIESISDDGKLALICLRYGFVVVDIASGDIIQSTFFRDLNAFGLAGSRFLDGNNLCLALEKYKDDFGKQQIVIAKPKDRSYVIDSVLEEGPVDFDGVLRSSGGSTLIFYEKSRQSHVDILSKDGTLRPLVVAPRHHGAATIKNSYAIIVQNYQKLEVYKLE